MDSTIIAAIIAGGCAIIAALISLLRHKPEDTTRIIAVVPAPVGKSNHFYTTSTEERDRAIKDYGYRDEKIACYVFDTHISGSTPLYRLYNKKSDDHFYTTSTEERDRVIKDYGYRDEKIACYVFDTHVSGSTPLYRLYNKKSDDHFYTTSICGRDRAIRDYGYENEGIACYVFESQEEGALPLFRLYRSA
jgi:hypothetical protein